MKMYTWHRPVLTIVSLTIFLLSAGQPIPKMFVESKAGIHRQEWFINTKGKGRSKLDILKTLGSPTQPATYSYTLPEFKTVLDAVKKSPDAGNAVKMYFAIFDVTNPGPVPVDALADKEMIVLFMPAELGITPENVEYASARGKFHYLLLPGKPLFTIDTAISGQWIRKYVTKICTSTKGFISTIDRTAPENLYNKKYPSDTRSMYYPQPDLDELFMTEVANQHTLHMIDVTGVQMHLSCYPDTVDNEQGFMNRVLIQFDLMMKKPATNIEEPIYLDEQTDYHSRRDESEARFKKDHPGINKISPMMDFDNGQLCPLNCPPPGQGLPLVKARQGEEKKLKSKTKN